jgi:hypothetical protein
LPADVEVKVEVAWPELSVPAGGVIVPSIPPKLTAVSGTKVVIDGTAASELWVISVVIVDVLPNPIVPGDALMPSTSQGLKSTVPRTPSQPVLPGPALQPHQLFSAVTVPSMLFRPATLFPTIRLKLRVAKPWLCTNTPVPPLLMVLLVNFTGWLPVKFDPAIH